MALFSVVLVVPVAEWDWVEAGESDHIGIGSPKREGKVSLRSGPLAIHRAHQRAERDRANPVTDTTHAMVVLKYSEQTKDIMIAHGLLEQVNFGGCAPLPAGGRSPPLESQTEHICSNTPWFVVSMLTRHIITIRDSNGYSLFVLQTHS